jgi:hypothetical protein
LNRNVEEGIKQCEDLIKKIKGVSSAKIITDADGAISEIHVISESDRNPRQIVRDIESTLVASLGNPVDHKKISVAQIGDGIEEKSEHRIKIEGLILNKSRMNFEAAVSLRGPQGGEIYEGRSSGVNAFSSNLRTVAEATINAVKGILKCNSVFTVEDVITFKVGNREAVGVLIAMISDCGEEVFIGSAIIKEGVYEAVMAAVLNAINRKIGLFVKNSNL